MAEDRTIIRRSQPADIAYLIQMSGRRAGTAHRLRDPYTVGRAATCDLAVDDSTISQEHIRIRMQDANWVASDLGTTNGMLVNGEATARQALADQDRIDIGSTAFVFRRL